MTLNFPTDTSVPYVDPVSGLKYVYNSTVGAWESAIQPPSIIAATEPDLVIEGFLWFNTTDGNLYVYNNGAWQTVGTDGGGSTVRMSAAPPATPANGDLWWDTESGRLYVFYDDTNSTQWIDAAPNQSVGGSGVAAGLSAPSDPQEGDLWLNLGNNSLNVYHNSAWVQTQPAVTGLQSLTVNGPITDTGTALDPILSVSPANSSTPGSVRFATQSEVNDASLTSVALTPGTLSNGIANYLPDADETTKGVSEIATSAEIVTGADNTKTITPAGLNTALPQIGLAVPPGTVITFAGASAPTGYLACDGSDVSRATYPDLYTAIADTYGAGDGASTFGLPDLRGEFVRGVDGGRGVDSGRALGSFQADEIKAHTHSGTSGDAGTTSVGGGDRDTDDASYTTDSTGGVETRPRNVALLYCIKS